MYRSNNGFQKTTAMRLQTATDQIVKGVTVKTFTDVPGDSGVIMCNFKTYGGTEKVVNNLLAVEDTAQIVCWYRPDITSACRLKRLSDNAVFEIIGEPENLEMRNVELQIKIRRVKGGA